jgi:hypothetical protein
MEWHQWEEIVAKLNASWSGQQIEALTAGEWYDELAQLDAGEVWLAIRQLRREQKWRPELAEILIACKLHRVEMAEQAEAQQRRRSLGRGGTPMPPETRRAREVLAETLGLNVTAQQKAEARAMIDALADQLDERLAGRSVRVVR